MVTPRPTFTATSITTTSSILRDPAELFDGYNDDPADCIAALSEALARVIAARPAFHDHAACRGSAIDFTSTRGNPRNALELCGACDVMGECRAWADEIGDTASVLGGEDPAARRLRWRQTGHAPPESMAGPT